MPPIERLAIPLFHGTRSASINGARFSVQPHPIPNLPILNELE